jgi:hypothetical protein
MWGKNRKIQELKDEMAAMVQRHDREIMQVHKGCAAKVMILERDLASQKSIAQTANKVADMHRRAEQAWQHAMMKTVGEDGVNHSKIKIMVHRLQLVGGKQQGRDPDTIGQSVSYDEDVPF